MRAETSRFGPVGGTNTGRDRRPSCRPVILAKSLGCLGVSRRVGYRRLRALLRTELASVIG